MVVIRKVSVLEDLLVRVIVKGAVLKRLKSALIRVAVLRLVLARGLLEVVWDFPDWLRSSHSEVIREVLVLLSWDWPTACGGLVSRESLLEKHHPLLRELFL